jgi:hypothetical protein
MSGKAIAVALLLGNADVKSLVGNDNIVGAILPQGSQPPFISATTIGDNERHTLAGNEAKVKVTEHVQLTIGASNAPAMEILFKTAKKACRRFVGAIATYDPVTCHSAGRGPDFEAGGVAMTTLDLVITYDEDA